MFLISVFKNDAKKKRNLCPSSLSARKMFFHWDATLESKLIKKIDVISKNVNNKKYAPKLAFFNIKNEKDSDDF